MMNVVRVRLSKAGTGFILASAVFLAAMAGLSGCKSNHSADAEQELARAKKLIAAGNFNEAFLQLNKALADAPRDPQVHLNLGWLYLYTDDPANAERELQMVENLAPDLADTYKLRGDFYSYKAQHDKTSEQAEQDQTTAVRNYEQALQRNPKSSQTYFDMANSLAALSRYEDALEALDKGFDYIPKQDLETQVNFQIASCSAEMKLKLYDEAIADCQQAYEFTNSPASKDRIESMIQNMKLMNPKGVPSLNSQQAPPEGSKEAREAEDQAIVNESAAD
jgi:tetratricopeptide (TPR) repeat protein